MTYGGIKQRVSDEMKRGELSVSSTAVSNAVIDAIKHFELRKMWFNEAVDSTLTTDADAPTLSALPSGMIKVDSMILNINDRKYQLRPMNYLQMDQIDSGQWAGYPEYYAFYANKIRLYPIPNGSYTVSISYVKRLPEISLNATANATNAWVNECEPMIRKRAKGELFQNELRNYKEAMYWFEEAEREYKELMRQNAGRQSGYILATDF